MLESIFVLFLAIALGLIVFAFTRRETAFLALGSVLILGCGLMLLDTSSASGIEETDAFSVNYLGDNNYEVTFNTNFRNAGNDSSLNVLGNLFLYGGMVGLMMSIGYMGYSAWHERRLK